VNKLPIAVIGCGYWGKNLVRVFSELGALECVCDANASRLKALSFKERPPAMTGALREALDHPGIRAVAIATPAATHYEIVTESLEAGKDVFVEKPLALTAQQGRSLVELAEKQSLILMVGHILLYHPAVRKLRQLIDEGQLGRVLYLYSNRLNMGLIRTEENILWSFAPHDISVMLHLLGEEPVAAEAEGQSYLTPGVVDVTLSRLRFASGVTGHIFVSWLHPVKEQRLVVVGTEKMAVFDDMAENKLLLYPHRVDWPGRVPKAVKAEPVVVEIEKTEPLKEECRHFLECVAARKTPLTDGREGLRVLRVLDRCQESLSRGVQTAAAPWRSSQGHAVPGFSVHPSASVDLEVSIGAGTSIGAFCRIPAGAAIGRNCAIAEHVSIAPSAAIGNRVTIQNGVFVADGVILEDEVVCEPGVVFAPDGTPRQAGSPARNGVKTTLVQRGAVLGANCTVTCGRTIGQHAAVAAGAVVTSDVPPFAVVDGAPAGQIGWTCGCGKGRLAFGGGGSATCPACGEQYSLVNAQVQLVG
jgi:UDP-2-acetamido-3-amino-2,3-dideoxy-glucuronate N-acetyltransferase